MSKDIIMLSGGQPNSFATGNPIPFKAEKAPASTSKAKDINIQSIGNEASDVQSKVNDKLSEVSQNNINSIFNEFNSKLTSLGNNIDEKIKKAAEERLNKTKEQLENEGSVDQTVKTTLGEELKKASTNLEDEKIKKPNNKNQISSMLASFKGIIDNIKKNLDKTGYTDIGKHAQEGTEWMQTSSNRQLDITKTNLKAELEYNYNALTAGINSYCKGLGESEAIEKIQEYNNSVRKQAKSIMDNKRKAEEKMKIQNKAAVQNSQLKIAATMGL